MSPVTLIKKVIPFGYQVIDRAAPVTKKEHRNPYIAMPEAFCPRC